MGDDDLVRVLPGGDELEGLIWAQPGGGLAGTTGSIEIGPDGSVTTGEDFRRAEASWCAGLTAIGRSGTGLILDEIFLGGGASQQRLPAALAGLPVAWVGVRCGPQVAAARECDRLDRVGGMARAQALRVHEGVVYDLVVDTTATTATTAADCANVIAAHLTCLGG